jgi:hypothetical protein
MSEERDLVEGRPRRAGAFLAGAIGIALIASLPFVSRLVSSDEAPGVRGGAAGPTRGLPEDDAGATARVPDLHGRLVYTTFETEGFPERQQRLMVLDLATGRVEAGPSVAAVEELWVAQGGILVLIADDAGTRGIAYAVSDLAPEARAVELARGDVLSLSSDRSALLVGRTGPAGPGSRCVRRAFEVTTIAIPGGAGTGTASPVLRGCGELESGVFHVWSVVSVVVDRRLAVNVVDDTGQGSSSALFRDLAVLSVSPRGTFLFADPEGGVPKGLGVWPRTPTGPLLAWPGSGSPRPLVTGSRLFAQRVIAWSPTGGDVIVAGIVGGERNLWRVYVPGGTAEPLLAPNSFPLRSAFSGATFDDAGNAFAGGPGTIVVSSDADVFPVALPTDAPSPVGPVAWLP